MEYKQIQQKLENITREEEKSFSTEQGNRQKDYYWDLVFSTFSTGEPPVNAPKDEPKPKENEYDPDLLELKWAALASTVKTRVESLGLKQELNPKEAARQFMANFEMAAPEPEVIDNYDEVAMELASDSEAPSPKSEHHF